jgi:hypothetical protein
MSKHVSRVDDRLTFLLPDTMSTDAQSNMADAIDVGIVANCGERWPAQAAAVRAAAPCISLLDAINDADRAMMRVVNMLQSAGDERWRPMSRLQSDFIAPIQNEETEKFEAPADGAEGVRNES